MKRQRQTYFTYVLFFLWMATGCTKSETEGAAIQTPTADRVVMVYMGGDNNLSNETTQKIEAMKAGWSPAISGKLLIFRDYRVNGGELIEVYSDASGATQTRVLNTYGQVNSADPEVFASALQDMFSFYQADSYGLIVFTHATGWLPQGALSNPYMSKADTQTKTILRDGNTEMDIVDFVNAMPDKAFDFIILEACLMAGVEVLYEMRNKTDYVVASAAEIFSPGFEPYYAEVIPELYKKQPDLKAFTHTAFSGMARSSLPWATFSVIRTAGLDGLAGFVRENGCRPTAENVDPESVQHFKPDVPFRLFFDFGDALIGLLKNDLQISRLQSHMNACVLYAAATETFMYNSFTLDAHSGMTTYIEQDDFPYLNEYYKDLAWYKAIH